MKIFCIDAGGTFIKYGTADEKLNIAGTGKIESGAKNGATEFIANIVSLCEKNKFDALAVASAGMIKDGKVIYANDNIPKFSGTNLKERLEHIFKKPVSAVNDVDAAALGEQHSSKKQNFYFLSLGTGVGGAFIRDGNLQNISGTAGEVGYLPALKQNFRIDNVASVSALEKASGENAKTVFKKAAGGDKKAKQLLDDWYKEIAHVLFIVQAVTGVREIVLGGAVSEQGMFLIDGIKARAKELMPQIFFYNLILSLPQAGKNPALIGAAKYLLDRGGDK